MWFGVVAVVAALGCAGVALWGSIGWWFVAGDYPGPPCTGCDSAGPPIAFLVHGHLSAFFSTQPFMGSVSLLLRAPFVALVARLGGDVAAQYRVGTLVCFLIGVGVLLPGVMVMLRRGQRPLVVLIAIAAIVAGPATLMAVRWGHPEELLGPAFAVAAVLAAAHRRGVIAGVLLGLAVATKQWGIFAALPVLMLVRGQRRQVALVSVLVAGAFIVPMLVGDPSQFFKQNFDTAVALLGVTPTNIWWPFHHLGFDPSVHQQMEVLPNTLRELTHPLTVALVAALSVVYWRRSSGKHPYDALQLLALLFLIRCVMDPLTMSYHHLPFVLTIAMFEGLQRQRIPIVTLISTAVIFALGDIISPLGKPELMYAVYLVWAVPTIVYLSASCLRTEPRTATPPALRDQSFLPQPA